MAAHETTAIDEALAARFGIAAFHAWQREAMEELLAGSKRVLLVAPTGGGKSLCYQAPALALGGTSVVISPLIALMDDQVRGLTERGIAATYLASTLEPDERRAREDGLARGQYQLVYVAPERLRHDGLVRLLCRISPPLVAVDEAHCISQWGHDFRPDYLRIGEVLEALRPEHVLACTATATPAVRDEILTRLGMPKERTHVVLRGFARPNLHLSALEIDGATGRRKIALRRVHEVLGRPSDPSGAAIVYAGTRRNTETIAAAFSDAGWRAKPYHAGLDATLREEVSAAFAERRVDVVVATNAFGMGIDRPDIRLVAHVQAPGSIEQYYQEVGRAGRDGQPAHGLLISGASDFALRRRLIASGERSAALEQQQWRLFLDLMRYVEAGSCRHDFILRYFEDENELLGGCGHCDVCERLEDGEESGADEVGAIIVKKALSGVARLRRRAGLSALAASLHGNDNERLRQMGLSALSTHGILSDHPEPWILALLRRLMTASLVDVTPGDFPVPFLTDSGVAVMKAERPVRVVLPPHATRKRERTKTERTSPAGVDPRLFDALKAARLAEARARGLPAYVVCHDRTLLEIAERKPQDRFELGQVHGMGPARIEAYGAAFLRVVADQR